jgi:hypothetical protein
MQSLHLQLYVTNCHLQLTMVTFVTISQVQHVHNEKKNIQSFKSNSFL